MSRDVTSLPPVEADRRVRHGSDASQFFDMWLPHGRTVGAAVMIHGGFWRSRWDLSHTSHLCSAFAKNGIATASLEYRRVGNPGGGWRGTYDDVLAGFGAARTALSGFGDPIVLGHSAGGHLALRMTIDCPDMRGVVVLAPVACLHSAFKLDLSNGAVSEFTGGTPETVAAVFADACPAEQAARVARVLIHGTNDDNVPISLSREFLAARKNDAGSVRLIEIFGAGHMDLIDPESEAFSTVLKTYFELEG